MNWAIRGDKEPDKNKQLHILSVKEYEELSEKLTKYKRAFEILKEYSHLPPLEEFSYDEFTNCYFAKVEEDYYNCGELETKIIHYVLEKEEYELLEELMNCGTKDN